MAKEAKVGVDTQEAEDKFIKLQLQIRQTTLQLQEAQAAGDKVKFNQLKGQLDELNDSLELTNLKSQQLDDTLAQQPGILGQVGNGLKGLDAQFKMLIANPVVAILSAIVGTLMLFKKALSSTSEGQETLNKVSQAFSKILGPLLAMVEKIALPVFEAFAFVLDKVGKAFSWFAEKVGVSKGKIAEATLSTDKVQQEANEKELKRQEEETKKAEQEAEKRKQQREKEAADRKRKNEEYVKNQKATQDEVNEYARQGELANKTDREKALAEEEKKYNELIAKAKKFGVDTTKITEAYRKKVAVINDKFDNDDLKKKEEEDKKKIDLQKRTNEALAISDDDKFKLEQQKIQEHYAELIKLNENNATTVLQLKEAQKQAELKLAEDYAMKEYAKTQEQRDVAQKALIDGLNTELEERQNVRIRNFDEEKVFLEQEFNARNQSFDQEVAAAEGNAEKIKEIEKRRTEFNAEIAEANKKIKGDEEAYKANAIAAGLQALDQAAELLGKDTVAGKAAAIASTTIRTYESAQKAYNSLAGIPIVGPVLGAIAAGVAVAGGIMNVKKIVATQVPEKPNLGSTQVQGPPQPTGSKFAKGGLLVGPSHSEGGIKSPYGELEGGEFVINKRSTKSFMPLLNAINSAGNRKYAIGGMTPSLNDLQSMMAAQASPVIKTYVVANDVSNAVQAEHKISQMARL